LIIDQFEWQLKRTCVCSHSRNETQMSITLDLTDGLETSLKEWLKTPGEPECEKCDYTPVTRKIDSLPTTLLIFCDHAKKNSFPLKLDLQEHITKSCT